MSKNLVALNVGTVVGFPLSTFDGPVATVVNQRATWMHKVCWTIPQKRRQSSLQGASNCIIATSHYQICCLSVCERVLVNTDSKLERLIPQPKNCCSLLEI